MESVLAGEAEDKDAVQWVAEGMEMAAGEFRKVEEARRCVVLSAESILQTVKRFYFVSLAKGGKFSTLGERERERSGWQGW